MALPWRILVWCCGGFLAGLFRKNCPPCGHPLSWHQRTTTGRFAD